MNVDVCIVSWKDKERKIKETDIKSNGDDGGEWKEILGTPALSVVSEQISFARY